MKQGTKKTNKCRNELVSEHHDFGASICCLCAYIPLYNFSTFIDSLSRFYGFVVKNPFDDVHLDKL